MTNPIRRCRWAAFAQLVIASSLFAGPLNPPAGPITSTAKPLAEIEPRVPINATNTPGDADSLFRITQSGSYYLTGNITGVSGKRGIEIASRGVTIDLNGFMLAGVAGSLEGIQSSQADVTVRNGHVITWGSDGVSLGVHSRVEGVTAANNGFNGIIVNIDSLVTGCVASGNTAAGINMSGCCGTVIGCHVGNNLATGILGASSTTVAHCTSTDNNQQGISLGSNGTVRGCTVTFNGTDGIEVASACVVADNTLSNNLQAGILVNGSDNRIDSNNCISNARGIDVNVAGNIIIRNTCSGNTTNWTVVTANYILVINATPAAPVNGNFGGISLGSNDPNANFSY